MSKHSLVMKHRNPLSLRPIENNVAIKYEQCLLANPLSKPIAAMKERFVSFYPGA
jgi:hypothetical protein